MGSLPLTQGLLLYVPLALLGNQIAGLLRFPETGAAVLYSPLAALNWPSAVPSFRVLASLAGLAVICTAVAFLVFFQLIAEVGPARSTVITYVNPAVAVLLGVLILNESFTATTAVGFVLILLGSVLATSRKAPAEPVVALAPEAAGFDPLTSSDQDADFSSPLPAGQASHGWPEPYDQGQATGQPRR